MKNWQQSTREAVTFVLLALIVQIGYQAAKPLFARPAPAPPKIEASGPVDLTWGEVVENGHKYVLLVVEGKLVGLEHDPECPCHQTRGGLE